MTKLKDSYNENTKRLPVISFLFPPNSAHIGGELGSLGPLVESIQLAHILLVESKVKDLEVSLDALGRDALRHRHKLLLQAPADENLGGLLVVLLGDLCELSVAQLGARGKRAVRLQDDVVGAAEVDQLALLAPGVEL